MTTRRIVDITIADTTGMKRLITGTNLAQNPRGVTTAGVSSAAGTGGNFSRTYLTTGGPLAIAPSFIRVTLTAVPTAGSITVTLGAIGITDVDASHIGKTLPMQAYARVSKPCTAAAGSLGWYNGSTFLSASPTGPATNLPANTWTRVAETAAVVPASTTRGQLQINFPVSAFTSALTVGDTIDVTAFSFGYSGPYFDGDAPGAAWAGMPHASRSSKIVGIG